MKIIITRNTSAGGESYAADLKRSVDVPDQIGQALINAGKAKRADKGKSANKTLRNGLK